MSSGTAIVDLGVDDLVYVSLDTAPEETLAARIVEVAPDRLALGTPVHQAGEVQAPPPGAGGTLVWRSERGLQQAPVALLSATSSTWQVRMTGDPVTSQRRTFVRVDCTLPLTVEPEGESRSALALDVSEGGARVRVPGSLQTGCGDVLQVRLGLPTGPLTLDAEVVRVDGDERLSDLGLRFSAIPVRAADAIRQYVFAELRRRRAHRLA